MMLVGELRRWGLDWDELVYWGCCECGISDEVVGLQMAMDQLHEHLEAHMSAP